MRKKIGSGLIIMIFLMNGIIMASAQTNVILIGNDRENDVMLFSAEWLVSEGAVIDLDDGVTTTLDALYVMLHNNWYTTNRTRGYLASNPNNDIQRIELRDMDLDIGRICLSVYGNFDALEYGFIAIIWNDCGNVPGSGLTFLSLFIPGGIGGEDILMAILVLENGTAIATDTATNFGELSINFETNIYDENIHCTWRAILMSPEDEKLENWFIDIFPDPVHPINLLLWIILFLFLLALAIIVIYKIKQKRG